jgi:UDP-N-acetylglucosamine 2-epimerase
MMMLHYCAGLQYCLDQEEEERQKVKDGNEQIKGIEMDLNVLSEQTIEVRKLTEKIHCDSEQEQTKFMSRDLSDSIESSSSDSCDLVLVRGDRTSIGENPGR